MIGAAQFSLVILRTAIGWHFLYEGYLKMSAERWSAGGYLSDARGPCAGWLRSLAQTGSLLSLIDSLTVWGLFLVGLLLMLGWFSRLAAAGAVLFLALFYLSNPPWPGVNALPGEGVYLIVNKNLIELCASLVLIFIPTGKIAGLDLFFGKPESVDS